MLKCVITAVVCFLAFEVNAATVLLRDHKSPRNEEFKALNELYLTGAMEGFLTFNANLVTDRKQAVLLAAKAGNNCAVSS